MTLQQAAITVSKTLPSKEVSGNKNELVSGTSSQEKDISKLEDGKTVFKKKKWKWRKNKKRTPKQDISENLNSAKTTPTNLQVKRKYDESSAVPLVAKKKRKKNMEVTAKGNATENKVKFKPVLVVKKPEDYSANWKQLKEMITQSDEKSAYKKKHFVKNGERNTNEFKLKDGKMKKYIGSKREDNQNDVKEKSGANMLKKKEKLEIWFDNVDPILLEGNEEDTEVQNITEKTDSEQDKDEKCGKAGNTAALVKTKSFAGVTKVIAMDCEMVGTGVNGEDSILARVSIVNHFGKVLYDKFVKPTEKITDYRTKVSGIRSSDLKGGSEFSAVQKEVSELLGGRILVGHSVHNDLKVLFLSHSRLHIRDTSRYKGFRRLFGGRTPSLKKLTEKVLGVQIQHGEHSSVQDAQAAMRLYTMNRKEWEQFFSKKQRKLNSGKKTKTPVAPTVKENTEEAEN